MKRIIIVLLIVITRIAWGQTVTTEPAFPKPDQPLTITVDVTGTSLAGYTGNVYAWLWIADGCTSGCDAPTNVNPATSGQDAAKAIRTSANVYRITLTPTVFFNKPASEFKTMGIKLKSADWGDNKQTDNDKLITFSNGNFLVSFSSPSKFPVIKNPGDVIHITGSVSESSHLTLTIDGLVKAEDAAATSLSYDYQVTEVPGTSATVTIEADNGKVTPVTESFTFTVRVTTISEARPTGIIDGINYPDDPSKVIVSLWAPHKTSVYAIGDFNNWGALAMKKDGEHFWIEIDNLEPGKEYAYQYLVDETVFIADPYADKILSADDDKYIPASSYPDLKPYPEKAKHAESYFNRTSIIQTSQQPYAWKVADFKKPVKENIVIYELLIRDFFGSDHRNYQALIDTIGYFKKLGINAIELMPVMEFSGNDSWGYNPDFMFAPDKYYGTKNKLKEFIDLCHQNGIAVILDMVMNHQDLPNPYVMMYFDFTPSVMKPTADNPWFNVNATHPFSVFYDLNHESTYTKKYLDTVNYYWFNEYKVDGLRFDLSKGFTQTVNTDVSKWSAYDPSRIAILKRMADKIWLHTPDAYIILEHFADNAEDKELAEYRYKEGKGMMPWSNLNYAYNQLSKGFVASADISQVYFVNKGWETPHAVTYMESHDEERLMYNNLLSGNSSTGYNVRNVNTAIERMKGTSLLFFTIPGPKMLWEFGELGYDLSINACSDGSISTNCRVSAKPVKWDYFSNVTRKGLYSFISDLLKLRNTYTVFTQGTASFQGNSSLTKQITLKNTPYTETPLNAEQINVQIVVNEDVTSKNLSVSFPHTGTWYDYYGNGQALSVKTLPYTINLDAGDYKLFTDVAIRETGTVTAIDEALYAVGVYPNPTSGKFFIAQTNSSQLNIINSQGVKYTLKPVEGNAYDISWLPAGIYVVEVVTGLSKSRLKLCKI